MEDAVLLIASLRARVDGPSQAASERGESALPTTVPVPFRVSSSGLDLAHSPAGSIGRPACGRARAIKIDRVTPRHAPRAQ